MLTAMDEQGQRLILQKSFAADDLKKLRDTHQFYCEVCKERVTLKIGEQITPHFAHRPNTTCEGENEAESIIHRNGKLALYQWLENQGLSPVIELYFPDIRQRADIAVMNQHVALEYQCSSITPKRYEERTKGYKEIGMGQVWILGGNRLKRYGEHIYKWMQTDQLMPRTYDHDHTPYLIFFDGTSNTFTILHHFWSLSSSSLIAAQMNFKTSDFTLDQLMNPPKQSKVPETMLAAWLQQKEKWRTHRNPHLSHFERYILTICARSNLSFSFFPSYIGLPIPNDLHIASPAYLWQAWLVLQFLYQRPVGTFVHFKAIETAFQRLVDKKLIALRPGYGQTDQSLKHYLHALERFAIIKKVKGEQYVLVKEVIWEQRKISEFRRHDAAALWRWLDLEL